MRIFKILFSFVLVSLLLIACKEKEASIEQKNAAQKQRVLAELDKSYTAAYNRAFDIDVYPKEPTRYYSLLTKALALAPERAKKIRPIIIKFRDAKKQKPSPGRLQQLVDIREKEFETVLSPIEIIQKRFVNLRFNDMELKHPLQVTNIQKTIGLSDGQVLKYIEIVELYKFNQDEDLLHNRLKGLLDMDTYHRLVDLGIFYK